MSATPLAAADEPICANCWDGPEMFEHRRDLTVEPVVEAISAISIGVFPDKETCSFGEVSAAAKNPVSEVFILVNDDGGYRLAGEPPADERATAAYLELRALTTEQIEKLVRESQESF